MVFQINALTIIVIALLGGVSSILVNKGIAVFHDGLRPIMPQHLQGTMSRGEILATSFALSFGLVVGFGLPVSIAGGIIIIHTLLLGTDIIGLCFKPNKLGMLLAGVAGALYGVLLMVGMKAIVDLFAMMPVNFLGALGSVGDPVIIAFTFFPALAIAYQHGYGKGFIAFAITVLAQQFFKLYGTVTIGTVKFTLSAEGMALLIGMVIMIVMAFTDKKNKNATGEIGETLSVFGGNVKAIQKNAPWLMLSGGLTALACTLLIVAEGPNSLTLTAKGMYNEAALVALSRSLGFIPLVMLTAIVGGVYSPEGTKMLFVPAIVFITMGTFGLVASFVCGAVIMLIEVFLLKYVAIGLDKFPGVKDMGDNIRTAMSKVLEIALLLGGFIAAGKIAPTFGYLWIMGLYLLNKTSKKPITEMAIGPLGAISLGVLVNILYLVGLYKIPV